jgi:hypothetical protein
MPDPKAGPKEEAMFPHYYCIDAYYAEQAAYHEAHRTAPDHEKRPEFEIPFRWIMCWFGAVMTLGLSLGGILHWIA